MKNKLIRRLYVILLISILLVFAGVYGIFYALTHNAMMNDMRARADGVRYYIFEALAVENLAGISEDTAEGEANRQNVQETLNQLKGVGGMKRLYISMLDESDELMTSLNVADEDGNYEMYIPTGRLKEDLHRSFDEGTAVLGSRVYEIDSNRIYSIFWPVLDAQQNVLFAVSMEFDVSNTYDSLRLAVQYSLALSIALILVISFVAYLSMSRATEPFYKKLAYTDILTELQNRMAYEQRLRSCESLVLEGKPVSLMMFDINDLKKVNDAFGHKAGDKYIVNTTKVIVELLDGLGEVYRTGGDEFAAIIVNRSQNDVEKVLNALHTENRIVLRNMRFSCAVGFATFNPSVDSCLQDLAHRADREMYKIKREQKERATGGRRQD